MNANQKNYRNARTFWGTLSLVFLLIGFYFEFGFFLDWWNNPELTTMQMIQRAWGNLVLTGIAVIGFGVTMNRLGYLYERRCFWCEGSGRELRRSDTVTTYDVGGKLDVEIISQVCTGCGGSGFRKQKPPVGKGDTVDTHIRNV